MFETVWKKILHRRPLSFWGLAVIILWPVSVIYRVVVSIYRRWYSGEKVKVSCPVIAVGSVSVGGSGKTPLVMLLASFLNDEGFKVGIVSSGYGRRSHESIIAPGYKIQDMPVPDVGDEVKLLSQNLPEVIFSIADIKAEAAKNLTEREKIDIVIVDDGFQHFRLHRDLDVITFDAAVKRRLYRMFPLGVLREPLSSLSRADLLVITRCSFARDINRLQESLRKYNNKAPFYRARFSVGELVSPDRNLPSKYLEDKSVFLFAGIGNFRPLKKQVSALSADLDYALELSDHQVYDDSVLNHIKNLADRYDSDVILTTAKDWVKLGSFDFGREIYYLAQTIDLDPGEEKLIEYLKDKLDLHGM